MKRKSTFLSPLSKTLGATLALGLVLALGAPRIWAAGLSLEAQTRYQDSHADEAQGQVPAAIQRMAVVYKQYPTDYLVNLRLGWLFYLDKKYKNSIDHYTAATQEEPASIEAYLGLTLAQSAAGDWNGLAVSSAELLKRDPSNYLGKQRLGLAYLRLKRFPAAAQLTAEALKAYPADAVFLEQRGMALHEQGQDAEARNVLTLLLLVSPKNVYARTALGAMK